MGLNILFRNCQSIRPKRKEQELYIKENEFDIVALNETFLSRKHNFKIPGYDTTQNDRSTGTIGGVAFLIKHGLVVNKEYRNEDFNIITDNEALAINLDLSNNQNITLATIYCPNGNPNLSLFQIINNLSDNIMFVGDFNSQLESFSCAKKNASGPMFQNIQNQLNLIYLNSDEHTHMDRANGSTDILDLSNNQNITLATIYCPNGNPNLSLFQIINNLSDNVMFVGDFNSQLESFSCAKKNASGPMLQNIQNQLNLIYLNSDEHTHMDRANGSTDILDMAFISPKLAQHDIQFQIGDDLGSDHLIHYGEL